MLINFVVNIDSISIFPMIRLQLVSHQRILSAAVRRISARSSRLKIGRGSLRQAEITSIQTRRQEQFQRKLVDVLNLAVVREADPQSKFDLLLEISHPLRHRPKRHLLSLPGQSSLLKNGLAHSRLRRLRPRLHVLYRPPRRREHLPCEQLWAVRLPLSMTAPQTMTSLSLGRASLWNRQQ